MLSWPSSPVLSQNCLSHPIKAKSRLKLSAALNRNFYVDHHSWLFFQSSKRLEMVVTVALINWVEICWRATGDTGTVVKLGQCQTLQPWLSLFPLWKHILSYINPVSLFIRTLHPFIAPSFVRHFPFAQSLPGRPVLFIYIVRQGNDETEVCCTSTCIRAQWIDEKSMRYSVVIGAEL